MITGVRGSRIFAALVSVALVAALAGCAPAVHPSPSATASAKPTPTATAEPQSATPPPLLGGDCSKLVPLADVVAATATPTIALQPAPTLNDLYLLPVRQAGGLECDWRDSAALVDLDVSVLPNAREVLTAATERLDAGDDGKDSSHIANVPAYGDQSWADCISTGEDPSNGCWFDIRVGSFWIEINQVYGGQFAAYPQAPTVSALLTHLVSTVRALPPVRAWKPDVGSLTMPATCSATLPLATVRSVTGGANLQAPTETETFNPLLDGAFIATGSLFCQWFASADGAPVSEFDLTMVPGSTWAWSATTGPPTTLSRPPLTRQTGLGTAAFGGCQVNGETSACDLLVLANHTWFELRQDNGVTHPATLTSLTSLAHSYLTTIGFTG